MTVGGNLKHLLCLSSFKLFYRIPEKLFTVLEARSQRSRNQQIWYLVGAHFLVHRWFTSPCVISWWKGKGAF